MFKYKVNESGFTLMELLVVIAILGILAAIVIPTVVVFMGEGTDESARTEYQNMITGIAILQYMNSSGSLSGTALNTWTQDFRGDAMFVITKWGDQANLWEFIQGDETEFWYFIEPNGDILGAYDPEGNMLIE